MVIRNNLVITGTIFTIIVSQFFTKTSSNIMASKRVVEVENIMPCQENNHLESPMRNVRFFPVNRTHKSFSYDVEFKRPIDENVGGAADIERWGNAGWVSMPFMPFQPDICNFMNRFFKDNFVSYNRALGVKNPDVCPIPAGNYSMKNFMIDFSPVTVPMWTGKLRLKFKYQLAKMKKTIYCSIHLINSKEIIV